MTDSIKKQEPADRPSLARMVVVETVYHAVRGRDPVTKTTRLTRSLESDEQPYERLTKIGLEWTAIDTGWLKGQDVSTILLSVPSGESKSDMEIGVENPAGDLVIIPFSKLCIGDSIRITPIALALFVRSVGEGGKISITVYPK